MLIQSSCKQLPHFLPLLRIQAFFLSQLCFAFGNLPGMYSISTPVGLLCVGNKAHSSALSILYLLTAFNHSIFRLIGKAGTLCILIQHSLHLLSIKIIDGWDVLRSGCEPAGCPLASL